MSTTTAMMWGALTRAAALPKMSAGAAVKALARMTAGTAVMVLALVMTMMMTACSGGDDSIVDGPKPEQPGQPEQPAAQGTTVHVSVGAGIDAAGQTRSAVVTDGGKRSLRFTAGDRLFIFGELNDGGTTKFLAGYLALVGEPTSDGKEATFAGDLKVYVDNGNESTYTFTTADPLSECSGLQANLIAGGFVDGFFQILGNHYSPNYKYEKSLTTGDDRVNTLMTKGMAVMSTTYSTADGFTNFQGDAILNCTISGLESNNDYSVKLLCTARENIYNDNKDNGESDAYSSFNNSATSSDAGVATFAIPIESPDCSDRYVSVALKIDDNYLIIPLGKITQTKNKVYNLSWDFNKVVDLAALDCDYEAQDGDILTGTLDVAIHPVKISIADGAKVRFSDVTINGVNEDYCEWAGITCEGDAEITLVGTNTVKGFYEDYPGIYVPENKTLTIKGSGSLNASSNSHAAGIGGGYNISCGNITISGGTVTATGGYGAAGIGGGYSGACGAISISGGTVTATGGSYSAGIGSGSKGACGDITISSGTVEATGGYSGAGIGSGYQGSCGAITIENTVTKVTATKGSDAPNSIGVGLYGTCGMLTIGDSPFGYIDADTYTWPEP